MNPSAAALPYLVTDAQLQAWRERAPGDALALAWALRQRDTPAALALLDAAGAERPRSALVRAECAWLRGDMAEAENWWLRAQQGFEAADDPVGLGDAWLLKASLLDESGGDSRAALGQALQQHTRSGDELRRALSQAWLDCLDVMADPEGLRGRFEAQAQRPAAGLATYVLSVRGLLAWFRGDHLGAVVPMQQAFDDALATGQLRSAVTLAQNLAMAFSGANDHESALQWAQRAGDLVRPTGWPYATAWTLMQAGSVLVGAGQAATGLDWLLEGLPVLAERGGTRNHVLACQAIAEACTELQRDDDALRWLDTAWRHAAALDTPDLQASMLRLRALPLARLGHDDEARSALDEARAVARAATQLQHLPKIEHMAARCAAARGWPAPAGSPHASAAIHHGLAALEAARAASGFSVPPDWYDALSRACEAAGDLAGALRCAHDAANARNAVQVLRSQVLLQTLRVRHETERAQAEAAQARAEAQALAARSELAAAQAQLERERQQAMLAHAAKLVAMGRLVAGTVHEMGHPVGTVSLLADALAATPLPAAAADAVRTLQGEARRLQRFVERLREFARAEPVQLHTHGLAGLVADARQLFGPRLALDRVDLRVDVADVPVRVDAERLCLVLANLAANAAEAMHGRPGRRLELHSEPDGDAVLLHMDDSGPGLSEAARARLFEPFFTTKPEGLGLGLALSAESLQAMGARLEAGVAPGGGARFSCRLLRPR